MNQILNNSQPYELVLVVMGILLFLALLFILIWNAVKKRSYTALLPFFIIPIGMVAYPTIKSFKVPGIEIEIMRDASNLAQTVNNNPGDTAAIHDLKNLLEELKANKQLPENSDALLVVAKAETALGRYDSATIYLNQAEKIAPESKEAEATRNELNNKIKIRKDFEASVSNLNISLDKLKETPGDTHTVNQVKTILNEIKLPTFVHPEETVVIAKSLAIAGAEKQSLQVLDKLEESGTPGTTKTSSLKDSIQNKTFQKKYFKQSDLEKLKTDTATSKTIKDKSLINNIRIYRPR